MGRKKQKGDESEAHPVGVGVGAATGAATGAVVGSAGGPIGTAVGSVVGGVAGGLAGKGVAEAINPRFEDDYWRESYAARNYVREGEDYETFAPAYRYGWESYSLYPRGSTRSSPSCGGDGSAASGMRGSRGSARARR